MKQIFTAFFVKKFKQRKLYLITLLIKITNTFAYESHILEEKIHQTLHEFFYSKFNKNTLLFFLLKLS